MRVSYYFTDKIDTYKIAAEVYKANLIAILSIEDSYGTDIDFEDFSESEKQTIYAKAYAAREQLEQAEEPDMDDDSGDDCYA